MTVSFLGPIRSHRAAKRLFRRRLLSSPLRCGHFLAALALFLSGAAGLIYEITWIRWAGLLFGSM